MREHIISTTGSAASFQIGPDPERDVVGTETLLMKLASIELVLAAYDRFVADIDDNGGVVRDANTPPDEWAVIGARQALAEVTHALECGCFGYQRVVLH